MLGLTGFSDMRDITKEIKKGNADARLAYELYAYRIKKYIGAYTAALNGLDALVFTAGVGENDRLMGFFYIGHIAIPSPSAKRSPLDQKVSWVSE